MKKLLTSLLALLVLLTVVGCSSNEKEEVVEDTNETVEETVDETTETGLTLVTEGVLTVSVSTDYAPMEFVDLTKTGQDMFVGSDIALAKYIAEQMGLTLEIKSMDFDAAIAAVNSGISDICISGLSYTSDRAASYLLTEDYFSDGDEGQVAVISKTNAEIYTCLADLNDPSVQVAAQSGALQMEIGKEQLPNCDLKEITNLDSAFDLLASGTYGAIISSYVNAESRCASNDGLMILDEYFDSSKYSGYHGLIKLGNDSLLEAVNAAIATIPEGQYAKWEEEAQALLLSLGDNAAEDIVSEEE